MGMDQTPFCLLLLGQPTLRRRLRQGTFTALDDRDGDRAPAAVKPSAEPDRRRCGPVRRAQVAELPLLGYVFSPEVTAGAIARSRAWLHRAGRRIAIVILCVIGALLIIRGIVTFGG